MALGSAGRGGCLAQVSPLRSQMCEVEVHRSFAPVRCACRKSLGRFLPCVGGSGFVGFVPDEEKVAKSLGLVS